MSPRKKLFARVEILEGVGDEAVLCSASCQRFCSIKKSVK